MGFMARFLPRFLLIVAASAALLACQSNPPTPQSKPVAKAPLASEPKRVATSANDRADVNRLLEQAKTAAPEKQWLLRLDAAELLIKLGDTAGARAISDQFTSDVDLSFSRTHEITARRALLKSHIAAEGGYYPQAYQNINDDELTSSLSTLPRTLAQKVHLKRAQYLFDMGEYSESITERVALGELIADSQKPENAANLAAIWQTLMEIPAAQIDVLAQSSSNRMEKAWYELASLSKNNQTNLREQIAEVDRWARQWPDHPASLELPADLQLLRKLYTDQPKKIALLMPKGGPLGGPSKAITDGFMAAYYQTRLSESELPEVRLYDANTADINSLYDRAVQEGAQMIIGPISKEQITDLSLRGKMPVPTLAMNTIDNPISKVPNLYQFGLGVEDEARTTAQKAWRDGHRRALVLAPNTAWGDRSVKAFAAEWKIQGGDPSEDYRFEDTNDYSAVIKRAMQIPQSEERAREIRSIVGDVEFAPRRRQDIDFIFLAAQPNQARQVKPMLAYHYANDIPVYGTSNIYSGHSDPKQDQDMNGVRFSTLPWFFNQDLPEQQGLRRNSDSNPNLQPLYAMGVDAFHLYARLKQLEKVTDARFYGQTGTLSLNKDNQIQRQTVWAEFSNGQAQPMATGN